MVNICWDLLQQLPAGVSGNNARKDYQQGFLNSYQPYEGDGAGSLADLMYSIDNSVMANPFNLGFTSQQNAYMPQNNLGMPSQNQYAQGFQNPMQGFMQTFMMFMQTAMQFMGLMMGNQQNNLNNTLNNQGLFNNGGAIAVAGVDANGNVFAGAAVTNPTNNGYNGVTAPNNVNGNYNGPVAQGTTGAKAAQIALHESTLGINEADGSYKKYGQPSHWCGAFAEWVVKQATGGKVPWKGENFHYVPNITNWAKKNGVYESYNKNTVQQKVKPGDMIIFGGGSRAESSHVGIVTAIRPDGTIETVEGNTSDACKKRVYQPGDPKIQGFLLINQLEAQGLI